MLTSKFRSYPIKPHLSDDIIDIGRTLVTLQ
jgi:hypothetical protein